MRAVGARQDVSSQRRSVDAEDLSNHVVMSVQRLSQMPESVADVEVVGQVELPRHLVGSAQSEEVAGKLAVVVSMVATVLVSVTLTHLYVCVKKQRNS